MLKWRFENCLSLIKEDIEQKEVNEEELSTEDKACALKHVFLSLE